MNKAEVIKSVYNTKYEKWDCLVYRPKGTVVTKTHFCSTYKEPYDVWIISTDATATVDNGYPELTFYNEEDALYHWENHVLKEDN